MVRRLSLSLTGICLCVASAMVGVLPAYAEDASSVKYSYTPLSQNDMSVVYADSIETQGEGANGAAALVLDGMDNTYWHTQWYPNSLPNPHTLVVDLGSNVDSLGSISLTPRQSSNGSGRVNEYSVATTTNAQCAVDTDLTQVPASDWVEQVSGDVVANPTGGKLAPVVIDFDTPVAARCVKVTYKSSWGGNDGAENVASLAEFNASTAVEDANGRVPSHPFTPPPAPRPDSAIQYLGKGVWKNPDDTPASPIIDEQGNFYFEQAHALYSKTDSRAWSFFSGKNFDDYQYDATRSNSGTNPDTTAFCNNSPTGKLSTKAPDADNPGASHSEANYCDLTNMWVDPDTGDWYGLVHNEFTPKPFNDGLHYDSIDYAVSHDKGMTWEIVDQVITSPYSTVRADEEAFPESTYYYGDGDPRLYVDYASGYFYAFYGSRVVNKGGSWVAFYEHVARAPISGKMAQGTWQKWYDGTWSEPGIGGKESNVVPVTDADPNTPDNPSGYTDPADEYKPTTPGRAAEQVANGTAPQTSPLFVMDISYNAYLGLYIGQPQNPDQSGDASQEFYVTDNLATQKWYYLGDSGEYHNASWYRWFLDPANKTNTAITGKTLRSYCSFGCMDNVGSEYINLEITPLGQFTEAKAVETGKQFTISAGNGKFLVADGNGGVTGAEKATEENGLWTFNAVGDGSYTITNPDGLALGVDDASNAGRAWDAPISLAALSENSVGQQWFVVPSTDPDTGNKLATIRLVNRYSGLALGIDSDTAATTPQRSWDAASASTKSVFTTAAAQMLTLSSLTSGGEEDESDVQTDHQDNHHENESGDYGHSHSEQSHNSGSASADRSNTEIVSQSQTASQTQMPDTGSHVSMIALIALILMLGGGAIGVARKHWM